MARFSSSWVFVSLSLALPLVGCGGTSEDTSAPDDPGVSDPIGESDDPGVALPDAGVSEEEIPSVPVCPLPPGFAPFAESFSQAVCEASAGCCMGDNLALDVAACVEELRSLHFALAKCVTVDLEAGDRCIAAMRDMESQCSQPRNLLDLVWSGCAGAISGTVPLGGTCETSLDCAAPDDGAAICHHDGQAGRCRVVHYAKEAGASCAPFSEPEGWDCDPHEGLYCDTVEGLCKKVGLAGEACSEPYYGTVSCVAGASCWLGVCEPLGQPGEPCGWDKVPCEGWCDNSTNTCVALRSPGESCAQDDECGRGAACSSGVCVPESYYLMLLSPAAQCRVSAQ